MKATYIILFCVTVVALLFCLFRLRGEKYSLVKSVRYVLIMGTFAVLMNTGALLTKSETAAYWFFGLLSIGVGWELVLLMEFTRKYTESFQGNPYVRLGIYILAVLDTISLLLNPFFHHAFQVETRYTKYKEAYYAIGTRTFYDIHLALSWILVVLIVLVLLVKVIQSPTLYRKKYILVLLVMICGGYADAVYAYFVPSIDIAVVPYAAMGICICYGTLFYVPKGLTERMLSLVVQEMDSGLVCFDISGKCVYINDAVDKWFHVGTKKELVEQKFKEWSRMEHPKDYIWDEKRKEGDITAFYRIQYKVLLDAKERRLGCFFTMQNRTWEEQRMQKERYLATHDRLTDIYNREYFYEETAKLLRQNPDEKYMLICSDIKEFKLINDLFGTETGDMLLCRISKDLKRRVKEGAVYGRLSGDRFALCLPKSRFHEEDFINGPQKMVQLAENFQVYIYVGVYEINNPNMPVEVMCDRARLAINTIKGNYHQTIVYYDDRLRQNILKEQEITRELEGAISNGEITIFLQPQISAEGRVLGGEALVRWFHPQKGMVPPGDFISVLEKTGLIAKLDAYVWELACRQLKKWKEAGWPEMYISVNISPKDFYYMDVFKMLNALVEKYDIPPGRLKLEITETTLMLNLGKNLELIKRLRQRGFVVEMDDFGSGYSSLNMLKDITVDMLKLDMAFLGETEQEEKSRMILKTIVALAGELEIPLITEGVETREQVEYLTEIGCHMFQGYYFAKPMRIEEFEEKYMEKHEI